MQLKRIIRDVLILVVFCGVFFGVVQAINYFGKSDAMEMESEYSQDRALADYNFAKNNYQKAAEHYSNLIEKDPDNSHAWYNLAMSFESERYRYRKAIWRQRVALRSNPNKRLDSRIPVWEERALEFGEKAIEPLTKCMEFQRYRDIARIKLAQIYAVKGEPKTAINYLQDALNEGFHTKEGIQNNSEFSSLRFQPEFRSLVMQDQRNRNRRYDPENTGARASMGD